MSLRAAEMPTATPASPSEPDPDAEPAANGHDRGGVGSGDQDAAAAARLHHAARSSIEATTLSRTKFRLSEPATAIPWAPAPPTATLTSSELTSMGIVTWVYPKSSDAFEPGSSGGGPKSASTRHVPARRHLGVGDGGADLVLALEVDVLALSVKSGLAGSKLPPM